ncbi:MAG: hypothetical protein JSV17_13950 [Candidatus Aminicenantes bacterium]|nr:MAG: hypothetical protein JSV17_13950 [Candidatus Aminicenantes bacterium]
MTFIMRFFVISVLLFTVSAGIMAAELTFDRYHTPAAINAALQDFARANPVTTKLHTLARSAGGRDVLMLEIGPEVKNVKKVNPAVLAVANMEGTVPLSSEAALYLIKLILEKPDVHKVLTWYVLPCGNPDAAIGYFQKPLMMDPRNTTPFNDDRDDQTDEDDEDDLDGNGIITTMRVKDPEGRWMPIPGEARLMKRADWAKGEKGLYKLYTEGLDNDADGEYNEDGPGGVNIGITFPHLFKFFTETGGRWSGSEEESFNLIKFSSDHREIGMAFVFGASNFCLNPPRGGRRGEADLTKLKIPERFASFMGADPNQTYSMEEVIEMVRPIVPPGMEVDESMVAGFLGLGAVVNPLTDDLKFYKELSDKYKEFLKDNKIDIERLDPAPDKDGSFELWAYYHLGLPSFAMDFWTLPKVKEEKKEGEEITPEKLEKMTNEEFIALGEEKIEAFLKSSGAPANFKAEMVIDALKSGKMDTKKMAEMMKKMPQPKSEEGADPRDKALLAFSDKELGGKGFLEWTPYQHPTLGEVEIGGEVPFVHNTPPAEKIEGLLKGQVPWVFEISQKMARIKVGKTEVKPMGSSVYQVKVWVENTGYLPYPTAMAKRNKRIQPVVVTLEGDGFKIVDGKKRSLIQSVAGNQAASVTWIVFAEKPTKLTVKVHTEMAWSDAASIALGGSR